jgi:hypothetical protein
MSTLSIVCRRGRKGAVCVVEHLLRPLGPGALGADAHAGRLEVREEALVVGAADDGRLDLSVVAPDLGGVQLAL